jgi:hypothetical protein
MKNDVFQNMALLYPVPTAVSDECYEFYYTNEIFIKPNSSVNLVPAE